MPAPIHVSMLATLCTSAAAFSVPHSPPAPTLRSRSAADVQVTMQLPSLPPNLPSLSTALTALITVQSAYGLTSDIPALFGPSPDYFGTAVNAGFLVYGVKQGLEMTGLLGKSEYYGGLEGMEVNSFAKEAGEYALAGVVPTATKDGQYEIATFAGGCFWGTELHYQRLPGVVATCVGYTQGAVEKPSYQQVCSGTTGHTEGIQLAFDPAVVTYDELCDKLLDVLGLDVTELNQVGNDRGTQYRHGIYPHTPEQAEAAARAIGRCQARFTTPEKTFKVVTEVKDARVFWPAEGYHQRYLEKGGQSAAKNAQERVRCYG